MNNAEKFEKTFGIYATELWSKPEGEFLEWLNAECDRSSEDLISRKAVLALAKDVTLVNGAKHRCIDATQIHELPSAVSEEFEWCHDCKEYDQEAHCCHRWTKVIRNTVEELKIGRTGHWVSDHWGTTCSECGAYAPCYEDGTDRTSDYCPDCGAKML